MRLAILGASGHGKVVADAAEASGWNEVVFFDDTWPKLKKNGPWDVQGDTCVLISSLAKFDGVVVGIGNNATRASKQEQLIDVGANMVSIIHPNAMVSPHAKIATGSVVFAQSVVNACANIRSGVIVNTGAVVEHDCVVGDFSHISPNAVLAGGVTLQTQSWVGACASVRQLLEVGEAAIIGMGAVVIKDVPPGVTVVGNPAKVFESR